MTISDAISNELHQAGWTVGEVSAWTPEGVMWVLDARKEFDGDLFAVQAKDLDQGYVELVRVLTEHEM